MSNYTLAGEDPDLTANMEKLRGLAELDGIFIDVADFGGTRTETDTLKILAYRDAEYAVYLKAFTKAHPKDAPTPMDIWRPIAHFGSSLHNYGCARDVKIIKKPESFSEAECFRRLGAHALQCGLVWGGTFKTRVDPPHFQLRLSLIEAKQRWQSRQLLVANTSLSKPDPNQT